MMSPAAIHRLSSFAAAEAAENKKEPVTFFSEEEIKDENFFLPLLGTYQPPGWRRVETLFVDKSGYGTASEPAMTRQAFLERLLADKRADKDYGYAVTEDGPFQCCVGVFEQVSA